MSNPVAVVRGYALAYDAIDDAGTEWQPGCLARAARTVIPTGSVKLFLDHGDSPTSGFYRTRLHIGTVRGLEDVTLPDGRRVALMTANIFDTAAGREVAEYLAAVVGAKSQTGLSIAVARDASRGEYVTRPSGRVFRFTDALLEKISITARQAVPGAVVTKLTMRPATGWATPEAKAVALRRSYGWTPERSRFATMEQRIAALRASYRRAA